MKQAVLRLLLALLFLVTFSSAALAGAWTAKKSAYYDKAAINYYVSKDTFNSSGNRTDTPNNGKFTDYNLSNYFEYGLFDNLTVINSVAYKWLQNEDNSSTTKGNGIGDIDLGLRYKLLDHEKLGIISTQLLVKVPGVYKKTIRCLWETVSMMLRPDSSMDVLSILSCQVMPMRKSATDGDLTILLTSTGIFSS